MQQNPLFSLITVCLDNLDGLRRTYDSLVIQTCRDFEWIIIDGGSADGTQAWLSGTEARWISERDSGLYDAMNKGLERAVGKYIIFLNAGDVLAAPETLSRLAGAIDRHDPPPDFIYGDSYVMLEGGRKFLKPARSHKKIARGMFTSHQAMLYRREAVGALRYDLRYKIAGDYDLTCRFLQINPEAQYCPFPVCIAESGGISQRNAGRGRAEEYTIRAALGMGGALTNRARYIRQWGAWQFRRFSQCAYYMLRLSRKI